MWKTRWNKDREKRSLWWAIVNNDVSEVVKFINQGADPNEWLSPYTLDENSLHVAVRCGHLELVELLLRAGADPLEPFRVGGYEFTCSESARALGFHEIAETLANAEVRALASRGPRPLRRHPGCVIRSSKPDAHP